MNDDLNILHFLAQKAPILSISESGKKFKENKSIGFISSREMIKMLQSAKHLVYLVVVWPTGLEDPKTNEDKTQDQNPGTSSA